MYMSQVRTLAHTRVPMDDSTERSCVSRSVCQLAHCYEAHARFDSSLSVLRIQDLAEYWPRCVFWTEVRRIKGKISFHLLYVVYILHMRKNIIDQNNFWIFQIFEDDGTLASCSTTAVTDIKRKRLHLHGAYKCLARLRRLRFWVSLH
jgi:hypothetical protein